MIKLFLCVIFVVLSDAVLGIQHYKFSHSANGWFKLHQVPATWENAFTTCNMEGALLASPLNEHFIDHLRVQMFMNKVDTPVYLGVNALRSEGYFVSLEGVPLDDMPIIWGSYGDGKETDDCLTLAPDGKVYTSPCSKYRPYFCYKKKEDKEMNESGTFDDNAVLGIQHYKFSHSANGWFKLHQVPATWKDAFTTCNMEGAILAAPLNIHFIDHLRVQMFMNKVDRPVYLGMHLLRPEGNFISLEGVLLDDMPIIWGSYGDGEKTDDCLTLAPDGKVYTSRCSIYRPYFCYKKKEDKAMNECGTFDDKYQLNETTGSCYKLHTDSKSWNNAQKTCLAEGGHLVVLNNLKEAEMMLDIYLSNTNFGIHVGDPYPLIHVGLANWNKDLITWITVTGENMENVYNEWKSGNPIEDRDNTCVCLLADGTLEINYDDQEQMFVCEKNPNVIQFEQVVY